MFWEKRDDRFLFKEIAITVNIGAHVSMIKRLRDRNDMQHSSYDCFSYMF